MSEASAAPKLSLKQHEQALDVAASSLDQVTDLGFRDTCRIIGRTLTYIAHFKYRFATKFFLMWVSLLTPLILPWPIKVVIDNVILGSPLDPSAFPAYFAPFVASLEGKTPVEMMVWVIGLGVTMVVLIGAFGSDGGANDQTDEQAIHSVQSPFQFKRRVRVSDRSEPRQRQWQR